MNKQEIIKRLTDLLATISGYYFKGRLTGCRPWVHERDEEGDGISIDLYNFGGDGEPVCDGLKPCTITYDDGSQDSGHLFCMCYNPDDVTPLVFLFEPEDDEDGTMDIGPEDVSDETLQNILTWLEAEWASNSHAKQEDKPDVKQATDIIALWSDWCMDYDDENMWLDYMVKHPKGHCNRQHLQEKWDYCYEKYGSKAAMSMFWRELDGDNRAILIEYVMTKYNH